LNVRLDYRLTYLLSVFKKHYENNDELEDFDETSESYGRLLKECENIFRNENDLTDLDLDGSGGKKFLRVLIKLIMQNYPQLVNGALKLLLRHFNQIQETLTALKQVFWTKYHKTLRLKNLI
jgi:hypothetical protein